MTLMDHCHLPRHHGGCSRYRLPLIARSVIGYPIFLRLLKNCCESGAHRRAFIVLKFKAINDLQRGHRVIVPPDLVPRAIGKHPFPQTGHTITPKNSISLFSITPTPAGYFGTNSVTLVITHRIKKIEEDGTITTKGDNNRVVDAAVFTRDNVDAKVVFVFNWAAVLIHMWATAKGK